MECVELKHSVVFAKYGTLSQVAKALHLSQPVLTRSMQHLEESLGVSLFSRTKNRIRLNETRKLVFELAKQVLKETEKMQDQLVAFDRSQHCFSIGACAPAPNIQMTQLYTQLNPGQAIYGEVADEEKLVNGLNEHIYDLIVMSRLSDDPKLASF